MKLVEFIDMFDFSVVPDVPVVVRRVYPVMSKDDLYCRNLDALKDYLSFRDCLFNGCYYSYCDVCHFDFDYLDAFGDDKVLCFLIYVDSGE
jgi:hypothetical protein